MTPVLDLSHSLACSLSFSFSLTLCSLFFSLSPLTLSYLLKGHILNQSLMIFQSIFNTLLLRNNKNIYCSYCVYFLLHCPIHYSNSNTLYHKTFIFTPVPTKQMSISFTVSGTFCYFIYLFYAVIWLLEQFPEAIVI